MQINPAPAGFLRYGFLCWQFGMLWLFRGGKTMRALLVMAVLTVLAGCGGSKHNPGLFCSAEGGRAAFAELRSHMRKQSNFYMAAEHKPIIQYMGGCKHGILAVAERKSSYPGILRSYSADVRYDTSEKRWVIENLDAD